jgi:hypothetical protein
MAITPEPTNIPDLFSACFPISIIMPPVVKNRHVAVRVTNSIKTKGTKLF